MVSSWNFVACLGPETAQSQSAVEAEPEISYIPEKNAKVINWEECSIYHRTLRIGGEMSGMEA